MNDHISLSVSPLSIGWSDGIAQTSILQDSRSENLKTVAASGALCQLDLSVQTLSISSGVAISKVVKYRLPIVLDCHRERQEAIVYVQRDLLEPSEVALQGNFFSLCFIDAVKGFFEVIGRGELREVLQPCFNNQRFMLVQVVGTSQKQVTVVHQCSALFVCQGFAYSSAYMFQTTGKQLQNMKLVYDQMGMGQDFVYCVMVAFPHISANNHNLLFHFVRQFLQILDNGRFLAVSKKVNDLMVFDISDDATVLIEQVQFINSDACALDCAGILGSASFLKDATNCSFIQPRIIGNAGKCPFERLTSNVEDQSLCHHVAFVHVVERLKEGFVASTATIAFPYNYDAGSLSSNGDIHEQLTLDFVSVERGSRTMRATQRNRVLLSGDLTVVLMLSDFQNVIMRPAKYVQEMLSCFKVLLGEFFEPLAFLVWKRKEFPTNYPTKILFHAVCRFLDVVYGSGFPRPLPDSRFLLCYNCTVLHSSGAQRQGAVTTINVCQVQIWRV